MSDLKLVSFEVNESGIYPLPWPARASEVRIFTGGCDGDELTGSDFVVEPDGSGGDQVRITKAHEGTIWIACAPDTSFTLTKFGVQMLPDLNDWFGRLSARLALMDHRLDGAIGSTPGCDGGGLLSGLRGDIDGLTEAAGNFLDAQGVSSLLDAQLDTRLLARKRALYPGGDLEEAARRASAIYQPDACDLIDCRSGGLRVDQDCIGHDPFEAVVFDLPDETFNPYGFFRIECEEVSGCRPAGSVVTYEAGCVVDDDPTPVILSALECGEVVYRYCRDGMTPFGSDVSHNKGDEIEASVTPIIAGFSSDCGGNCMAQYRCPTTIEQR